MADLDDTMDFELVSAVKKYMELLEAGQAPNPADFASSYGEDEAELVAALEGLLMVHRPRQPQPDWEQNTGQEFVAEPIGDFQLVREIGRGGMGIVYEARQRSLGRLVALKILPFASALDEVRLQRFRNEAHAAAALHHTHIVPVYAVGQERGVHYYAMQLIEGHALSETIEAMRDADQAGFDRLNCAKEMASGDYNLFSASGSTVAQRSATSAVTTSRGQRYQFYRWAVRLIKDAAMALEHAHRYGVIHRDIKPSNLMLDGSGKIWLTDFGLAQIESETVHLTHSGNPVGTMRYMSPEQAQGNRLELDHRTDIYSLGITLYELLTLQPAFSASKYHQLLEQVVHQDPPSPESIESSLPTELSVIITKAIAKLPEDRYDTAEDFAEDLQRWLADEPIIARPPTVLERLNKWRRRNSGIVASAGIILTIMCLSLAVTTALVWKAQGRTQEALKAEQSQRQLAEKAFQRARSAVDAYSQLSESELALRPELQNLRRGFLETSLEFYQEFIEDYEGSPVLREELELASGRVSKLVNELRALDGLSPYLLLVYQQVQDELELSPDDRAEIVAAVRQLQSDRNQLWERSLDSELKQGESMTELLADFEAFISDRLNEEQSTRLFQIDRQVHLPFTFRTAEIQRELKLTDQQKSEIDRAIVANRPRLSDGGPIPFDRRSPIEEVLLSDSADSAMTRPRRPATPELRQQITTKMQETTADILACLNAEQRQRWEELVGVPLSQSQ